MALGVLMLLGAGGMLWNNAREEKQAGEVSAAVTEQLRAQIEEERVQTPAPEEPAEVEEGPGLIAELDGDGYLGVLTIPALKLELPVMSSWNYKKLKKAPCRYVGGVESEDLVIAGHNYQTHFRYLSQLPMGSEVVLETMDGDTLRYEVVDKEVLGPRDVEAMTAGEVPLTLFTCTYGGRNRITLRCDWAA